MFTDHLVLCQQSKGQGDRTILIKGSADATRLANQWISAIIASQDKDLADIVDRAQYKQGRSQDPGSRGRGQGGAKVARLQAT